MDNLSIWLVVEPYPSGKNMSSSLGMMTFQYIDTYIWENTIHVPNHQPAMLDSLDIQNVG